MYKTEKDFQLMYKQQQPLKQQSVGVIDYQFTKMSSFPTIRILTIAHYVALLKECNLRMT